MDENATAPSLAPTDAPASTPAEAPAPEAAPAITAEQVAQYFGGTTAEGVEAIKAYYDNNGGPDKAMANMKRIMANRPQPQPQPQPQAQAPIPSPVNDYPPQPQPMADQFQRVNGGITPAEFMTQQYFQSLASQEKYANIADQITSGAVLKEMAKFNIQPIVNGQFNGQQIADFLDMYAKTVPPKPAADPITATPTVDYVQVPGDTITNMNQAMQVLAQDREQRALGRPGHPLAEQANKFFDDTMNAQANRGKRVDTKK